MQSLAARYPGSLRIWRSSEICDEKARIKLAGTIAAPAQSETGCMC